MTAAARALQTGNVDLVLPYVHPDGEAEVREAFARVLPLRAGGDGTGELADRWFYETVVRVHRAGEGAPYTGLKPAGLDPGPVLPLAEQAVATGQVDAVYGLLAGELRRQLEGRLRRVGELAAFKDRSVDDARAWVEAMLGFEVYAHPPTPRCSAEPTANTTTADLPLRRMDPGARRANRTGRRVLQSGTWESGARIVLLAILAPMPT